MSVALTFDELHVKEVHSFVFGGREADKLDSRLVPAQVQPLGQAVGAGSGLGHGDLGRLQHIVSRQRESVVVDATCVKQNSVIS